MKRWFSILLLLVASSVHAAGIEIIGPDTPIEKNAWEMLLLVGVDDINSVVVEVTPAAGVRAVVMYAPGSSQVLWFRSSIPGKYTITVGANLWRQQFDSGLAAARKAKIDPADVAAIEKLSDNFNLKYPANSGTASLEVAGSVPPPKPDPIPVTVGKRRIIMILESSEETSAISSLYVLLRKPAGEINRYLESKGHLLDILDPMNTKRVWMDALTSKGKTAGMVIADFDSSAVLAVVDFPTSPADFLAKLKENGG